MDIVQFTDFHFGNDEAVFHWRDLAQSLSEYIDRECQRPVIIVSGDVTYRGCRRGYEQAQQFFECMLQQGVTERERIIMCPGNHDIVDGSFESFDRFAYGVRRNNLCSFRRDHYRDIIIDNFLFKVFNSSYHLDHRYGLIDNGALGVSHGAFEFKIAVTHHHLLNMFRDDISAIRNSYDFVKYLDAEGFDFVFHGHQHAQQSYYLGSSSMRVISARSGNFRQTGFLNSVNRYRITDGVLSGFCVIPEKTASGIEFIEIEL